HVTTAGIETFVEDRFVIKDQKMAERLYQQGVDTSNHVGVTRYKVAIDTFEVRQDDKTILSGHEKPLQIAPVAVMNNYVKNLKSGYGSYLFFYDRSPLLGERS